MPDCPVPQAWGKAPSAASGEQTVLSPHSQCAPRADTAPSTFSLCCIAPVLAAKVIKGVEVTVGHEQEEGGKWPYAGTAEAIKALGAKHCVKGVTISFLAVGQCGVK